MADENPILNNPYEEPSWHYATNLQGELDYSCPVKGRRIFTPENLVPETWRKEMPELNKRLVITNYHAFEPKTLQGNKRSPFDAGEQRNYLPDFIVNCRLAGGRSANIVVEVTGFIATRKPNAGPFSTAGCPP